MRRAAIAIALLAPGCSLVFDPGSHMGGSAGMDAGGGFDGGPDFDAGPPPGPDAGSDASVPGVPLDMFCPMFVDVVCNSVDVCCSRTPPGWDQTTCRNHYTEICDQMRRRVEDYAYLEWDEAAAYRALVDGQAYVDDDCSTDVLDWFLDLDGYLSPIVGTRPAAADCTPRDPMDTYEVIAAVLSCDRTTQDLRCIRVSDMRWNCLPPSPNGMPCSLKFDCADPAARCVRAALDGTCQVPGEADGSLCILPDECQSLVCNGLRCAPATQDNVYCVSDSGVPD